MQTLTSKRTSQNQLPAIAREVSKRYGWTRGTSNFDLGAGRYNQLTGHLAMLGVASYPYDPYNRTAEENRLALSVAPVDTVTVANVLNVIESASARQDAIRLAAKVLRKDGVAYFIVYEGDRSGNGRPSKDDCWQENRKTETYVREIANVFKRVERHGKLIVAKLV